MDYAQSCYQQSGGLFDITAGILAQAWDFTQPRLPDKKAVAALLTQVGWHQVQWQKPHVYLPLGMVLDLGGVVKEYAVDCVASLWLKRGVRHGLVELGGDLRAIGGHENGQPWQVGIRHPRHKGRLLTTLALRQGALASIALLKERQGKAWLRQAGVDYIAV